MEKRYYRVRDLMDKLSLPKREIHRLIYDTLDNPIRARGGFYKFSKEEFDRIVVKGQEDIQIPRIIYVHTVWEIIPSRMNYSRVGNWIEKEQG